MPSPSLPFDSPTHPSYSPTCVQVTEAECNTDTKQHQQENVSESLLASQGGGSTLYCFRGGECCRTASESAFAILWSSLDLFRTTKGIILFFLAAQSSVSFLLTRYTRARPHDGPNDTPLFAVPTAVICTELVKLFASLWWAFLTEIEKSDKKLTSPTATSLYDTTGTNSSHGTNSNNKSDSCEKDSQYALVLVDPSASTTIVAHHPNLTSPYASSSTVMMGSALSNSHSSPSGSTCNNSNTTDSKDTPTSMFVNLSSWKKFTKQWAYTLHIAFRGEGRFAMLLPSLLFTYQNNILYVCLQNVEVTTFQVLFQSKLLLTAIFVCIAFKRALSRMQWLSLLGLFIGVVISQLGSSSSSSSKVASSSAFGVMAVLSMTLSSAFSAVAMEKALKDQTVQVSVAVRNIQLAVFGLLLLAGVYVITSAAATNSDVMIKLPSSSGRTSSPSIISSVAAIEARTPPQRYISPLSTVGRSFPDPWMYAYLGDFFLGYDGFVVALVLNQALGGILVALVLKYADNILKGFASSVCIFVCGLFSHYVWGTQLTPSFMLGATIVSAAVVAYGAAPSPK